MRSLILLILISFNVHASQPKIVASVNHTCSLNRSGEIYCWGANHYGELGNNSTKNSQYPTRVTGLDSIKDISIGNNHSCALKIDGTVYCWGKNSQGQIGNGSASNKPNPIPIMIKDFTNIIAISSGGNNNCALNKEGSVLCWGENSEGQVGEGTTTQREYPVYVINIDPVIKSITTGVDHSCALTNTGKILCWGSSISEIDEHRKTLGVTEIKSSFNHTCLLQRGNMSCFGGNLHGELGNYKAILSSFLPVYVIGFHRDIVDFATGGLHSCATTRNGITYCWGDNKDGQLGNNTLDRQMSPSLVIGLNKKIIILAAGLRHTCGITNDYSVKCWGDNSENNLGNGSLDSSSVPVDVLKENGELFFL